MTRTWIRESPAHWDADKARIIGGAPVGAFDSRYRACPSGQLMPGEWWRVEEGGHVVGYGWLDTVWGDAEILLATEPDMQRHGVGTFILERLEDEAQSRGLNYLYNLVRTTHPRAAELSAWLEKRGFRAAEDGRLLRETRRTGSAR